MNYYNEWDKGAAAWLRELIKQGHIPFGVVDERSITEVKPEDLDGFTQCHFFRWYRRLASRAQACGSFGRYAYLDGKPALPTV